MGYGGWTYVTYKKTGGKKKQQNTDSGYKKRPYYVCTACPGGWRFCDQAKDHQRCRCGAYWLGKEQQRTGPPKQQVAGNIIEGDKVDDIELQVQATLDLLLNQQGLAVSKAMEDEIRANLMLKHKSCKKTEQELHRDSRIKLEKADQEYIRVDKKLQHLAKLKKELAEKVAKVEAEFHETEGKLGEALEVKNKCLEEHRSLAVAADNSTGQVNDEDEKGKEDVSMETGTVPRVGPTRVRGAGEDDTSRSRSRSRTRPQVPEEMLRNMDENFREKLESMFKEMEAADAKKRRIDEDSKEQAKMDGVQKAAAAAAAKV